MIGLIMDVDVMHGLGLRVPEDQWEKEMFSVR